MSARKAKRQPKAPKVNAEQLPVVNPLTGIANTLDLVRDSLARPGLDSGVYTSVLDQLIEALVPMENKDDILFRAFSLIVLARFAIAAEEPPNSRGVTDCPTADAIAVAADLVRQALGRLS